MDGLLPKWPYTVQTTTNSTSTQGSLDRHIDYDDDDDLEQLS